MRRIRAESDEGYIRTTAALPPDLHRRLMLASVDTRMAATEILRRALIDWLDAHDKATKRKGGKR